MPSAVAWEPEHQRQLVGHLARARRGLEPPPVISVKSSMGHRFGRQVGAKMLSAPEISAVILRELVEGMRKTLQAEGAAIEVRRAIITIPADFPHAAEEATTQAGEVAGLEVDQCLKKPIAATMHYAWRRAVDGGSVGTAREVPRIEHFATYDLGGGTFDAAIVRRTFDPRTGSSNYEILGLKGDPVLGGDTFDGEIVLELRRRISRRPDVRIQAWDEQHAHSLDHVAEADDPTDAYRNAILRAHAETMKIRLSKPLPASEGGGLPEEVRLQTDLFEDDDGQMVHIDEVLTRQQLESLMRPHLETTVRCCWEALGEAGLGLRQIDTVLMVGGSSYSRIVQKFVHDAFFKGAERPKSSLPVLHSPDLCVGEGAALKAAACGRIWRAGRTPITYLGYGSFASLQASFQVELTKPDERTSLGLRPRIHREDGVTTEGTTLPQATRVTFEQVPLHENRITMHKLRLPAKNGPELAGFEFGLTYDPDFVEPIARTSRGNVLSYELGLEVQNPRTNETHIERLASKLSALPLKETREFISPGGAEALRFPLYNNRQLAKTMCEPLKERIREGARFFLTVYIDEAGRIRCVGEVVDEAKPQIIEFKVESVEPESAPSREEFREIEARIMALLAQGDASVVEALSPRIRRLLQDIDRAYGMHDEARIVARLREVRELGPPR